AASGKRLARAAPTGVVVVVVDAEVEGSPPRYLTAHLDPLELEPAEEVEQRSLFVGHEEVPLIREACGLLGHDRSIIRRSPGRGFDRVSHTAVVRASGRGTARFACSRWCQGCTDTEQGAYRLRHLVSAVRRLVS